MTLTLSSKCTIIWNILEISLQCTCCKMFAPEDWTFIGVIHRYTKGGCVKRKIKINVTQSWGHPPVPRVCYHWFIIISRFWCHPVTVCSLGHCQDIVSCCIIISIYRKQVTNTNMFIFRKYDLQFLWSWKKSCMNINRERSVSPLLILYITMFSYSVYLSICIVFVLSICPLCPMGSH